MFAGKPLKITIKKFRAIYIMIKLKDSVHKVFPLFINLNYACGECRVFISKRTRYPD